VDWHPGVAYCLDPLFVAANGTSGDAAIFPAVDVAAAPGVRLVRMSLRIPPAPLYPPYTPVPWPRVPIGAANAEVLFRSADDLVCELPADRTLMAQQRIGNARPYLGRMTWAATLVPKDSTASDFYVLSVVVFDRRDLSMPATVPSATEPDAERICQVQFLGGGLAGGEVRLTARPGRPTSDLHLRGRNWLMLAGWKPIVWNGQQVTLQRFGWYRVQNAVEDSTGCDATLFGQDWDQSLTTQAVLVSGVVAVYEKTIRLGAM
jgi:hypothetical protein